MGGNRITLADAKRFSENVVTILLLNYIYCGQMIVFKTEAGVTIFMLDYINYLTGSVLKSIYMSDENKKYKCIVIM